jgi:aminoglycoside phosphotransferase
VHDLADTLRRHGYRIDGAPFATARPGRATLPLVTTSGARAVAKVYPQGGAEQAFLNLERLWHSSFGERRQPPGVPEPIEYLPHADALVMERLEGRPLLELDTADTDLFEAAIRLLASLHSSDARPQKRRDVVRIVRSIRRKAERVGELAPRLADQFWAVVHALEGAEVADRELVASHGDFSPRNVIVGPRRIALVDFDRLQLADPARDVGWFGAWSWAWALREGRTPDWTMLDRAVALYGSLRPDADLDGRIDFHVAAGLMRVAHGLVEFWRDEMHLVPMLASEALRRLR